MTFHNHPMAGVHKRKHDDAWDENSCRKLVLSSALLCVVVTALVSTQLLKGGNTELSETESAPDGPSQHSDDAHLASRGRWSSAVKVTHEEKVAAARRKEMLRLKPNVEHTEDAYLAARARVASVRASISDLESDTRQLEAEIKDDNDKVSKAAEARKQMTMAVAAAESTLQQARDLAAKGRLLEGYSKESRSASELDESEGVAIQQPAEELLKDSKKLNDQSNLVLDQSHSPQAKALAALDLKMAQSLAQRAGKGMSSAKEYFARAIAARKRAVEEDVEASSDVRKSAKISLSEEPNLPALLHVMHGEVRGPQALADIITADVQNVEEKEEALGQAQGTLNEEQQVLLQASEQVQLLASRSAALKKELADAQKAVKEAEAAHQAAAAELEAATSQGLTAEQQASSLRSSELQVTRKQLAAIAAKKRKAEHLYRAALKKVADLNGHQTLLQVEVARLSLELKEAQMQRDDAESKQQTEQQTMNSLQVQLDKENEELSRARLNLADERLRMEPENSADTLSQEEDQTTGNNADDDASLDVSDAVSTSAGLDQERQSEARLREQQDTAERAAHDEELKLRRAQAAVAAQMAKVSSLEKNIR